MELLTFFKTLQIVTSVVVIGLVLVQSKGTGLSSAFGGSGAQYRSRRGVEKLILILTVVFGFLFVANSVAVLALS